MITKKYTFENRDGLYHKKVTLSLTPAPRLGNEARNYLVSSMITKKYTFENRDGLYHKKVTLSLTPAPRLGNEARNSL